MPSNKSEARKFTPEEAVQKSVQPAAERKFLTETQAVAEISTVIQNLIGSQDGRDFELAAEQIRRIILPDLSGADEIAAKIREAFVADDLKALIIERLNAAHIDIIARRFYRDFISDLKLQSIDQALADLEKLGEDKELPTWFVLEEKLKEMLSRGGTEAALADPTDAREILQKIYLHIMPEKAGEPMPMTLMKYADQLYAELNGKLVPKLQEAGKALQELGGILGKEEAVRNSMAEVLTIYREIVNKFEKDVRAELGK